MRIASIPFQLEKSTDELEDENVTAIVLEVRCSLVGPGAVRAWATVSLYGHAPEVQVSRWGLPMITHILLSGPALHDDAAEKYNRSVPADEAALSSKQMRDFVEKLTALRFAR